MKFLKRDIIKIQSFILLINKLLGSEKVMLHAEARPFYSGTITNHHHD